MAIVLDFAVMTLVWVVLYAATEDVFKFVSKYMIIFTALIASYEMIVVYGIDPAQYLFIAILTFMLLEITLDVLYLIRKPAEQVIKVV